MVLRPAERGAGDSERPVMVATEGHDGYRECYREGTLGSARCVLGECWPVKGHGEACERCQGEGNARVRRTWC